jgi:hypothetical protein
MRFQQSRGSSAFLMVFFALVTLGMGSGAIAVLREGPTNKNFPALVILIGATGLILAITVMSGVLLFNPMALEVDSTGLCCRGWRGIRKWSWDQVSQFRLGPRGYTIAFDVIDQGRSKTSGLPAEWPGGADKMIARLNAAQRQYTHPGWEGPAWEDAPSPKIHPVRQFAVGLTLGLVVCFGLALIGLARLHH